MIKLILLQLFVGIGIGNHCASSCGNNDYLQLPADTVQVKKHDYNLSDKQSAALVADTTAKVKTTLPVTISQTGQNNQVIINNQRLKATPNDSSRVTIKQSGKNNQIKINSH